MYTYPIIDRRSPAAGILDPDPEVGIPGEAGKSQEDRLEERIQEGERSREVHRGVLRDHQILGAARNRREGNHPWEERGHRHQQQDHRVQQEGHDQRAC